MYDSRENLFGGHKAKKAAKAAGETTAQAKQAAKDARKTTVKKDVAAVKKILTAAEQALANVGEDIALAPLLIFKPMMVKRLDSQGVSHSNLLGDIAMRFAKEVVMKSSNFESFETFYSVSANAVDTTNANDIAGVGTAVATGNPVGLVAAIIKWIGDIGHKKTASAADAKSKAAAAKASAAAMAAAKSGDSFWTKFLRTIGLKKKLAVATPAKTNFQNFSHIDMIRERQRKIRDAHYRR
jgi:hypothetical protein